MKLLELLFGKVEQDPPVPERPASVAVDETPLSVYAVTDGELMAMADIPDPVFASGAMGPAVGIKPERGIIFSPVTGEVTVTTSTLHALGLRSDDGLEILIHVGVDTVDMKGDGFHGFVRRGQHVRAGEPLMTMDLDKIAQAGYSDVAITVIINAESFPSVEACARGWVAAGARIMSVSAPDAVGR